MPNSSLRCLAASLVLHAALVGIAGGGSARLSWHAATLRAVEEEAIAIEAPDPSEGLAASSALPSEESAPDGPKTAATRPVDPSPKRPARQREPRPVPPTPAPAAPAPARVDAAPPSDTGAQPPSLASPMPAPGAARGDGQPAAAGSPMALGSWGVTSAGRGGGAGQGAPGAHATGDARARVLSNYLAGVRQRVAQHREYPYLARRANIEGTVCLRVVVAASGRVLGVTPTCGTDQRPLLDAALASVSSAAPFPPLPAALGQRLTVDVPVVFELDPM